jgi:hypothetical protein
LNKFISFVAGVIIVIVAIFSTPFVKEAYAQEVTPPAVLISPSGTLASWNNTFSWTGVADATQYRLFVSTANDQTTYVNSLFTVGTEITCDAGLNCMLSPAATASLPSGSYHWKLQDYGPLGAGTWTDLKDFTLSAPVIPSTLISPNGTLTSWSNVFRWTGVNGATQYRLYMSTSNDWVTYANTVYKVGVDVTCDAALDCTLSPAATANLLNGSFHWKVQDSSPNGPGTWTEYMNFTLNVPEDPVILVSPTLPPDLTTWNNTFRWTGISSASKYRLYVAKETSNPLKWTTYTNTSYAVGTDVTCDAGFNCSISPAATASLPDGHYRWQIQTYNPTSGFGAWTSLAYFTLSSPILISPSSPPDLATWDNIFRWTGVSGTTQYKVFVSTADGVTTYTDSLYDVGTDVTCDAGLNCTFSPAATASLPSGSYHWRVQPSNPTNGLGNWTAFKDFTLSDPIGTPVLISPASPPELTSWNNIFNWTGADGVTKYRLFLSTADGAVTYTNAMYTVGTDVTCDAGLNCTLSPAATASLPNGNYHWRLQPYNPIIGTGSWTAFKDFTLNIPIDTPVLVSPSSPPDLATWNNTFSWTGISDATKYRLYVATSDDWNVIANNLVYDVGADVICDSGLHCTLLPAATSSLPNGSYHWRIQAYTPLNGYGVWTAFKDFTLNDPIGTPELVSPFSPPDLTSWGNTFTWIGLSDATKYRLFVSTTNGWAIYANNLLYDVGSDVTCDAGLTCTLSPSATASLPNGSYHWRLQAYNPIKGYGAWTSYMNFVLADPSQISILISPTGSVSPWNNIFHWSGVNGATRYRVYITTANGWIAYSVGMYDVGVDVICSSLDCTLSPVETASLPAGSYRWKIQDYTRSGFGTWTEYMYFTIP